MTTGAGWFAVPRGWRDAPPFENDAYSRGDAWLYLLEHAAWRDGEARKGSHRVEVLRGQVMASQRDLAAAWRWSRAAVRRFLAALSDAAMIEITGEGDRAVLTLCDYGRHGGDSFRGPRTGPLTGPPQHPASDCQQTFFSAEIRSPGPATGPLTGPPSIKKRRSNKEKRGETLSAQGDLLPGAQVIALGARDEVMLAMERWNAFAAANGLAGVPLDPGLRCTAARRPAIAAMLRELGGCGGLDPVLARIGETPFLLGNGPRGWRATLDWLARPKSIAQVMGGQFDNHRSEHIDDAFETVARAIREGSS